MQTHREIIFENTKSMRSNIESQRNMNHTSLVAILKPRYILAKIRSINLYKSECSSRSISFFDTTKQQRNTIFSSDFFYLLGVMV